MKLPGNTHLTLVPESSSMPTPLKESGQDVLMDMTKSLLAEAAQAGAAQALRDFRQDRKLGRSDVGRASEEIGLILKQLRHNLGYTQTQLADLAGVHPTTIGKIENADRGMSLVTFAKIVYAVAVINQEIADDFSWEIVAEVAEWE